VDETINILDAADPADDVLQITLDGQQWAAAAAQKFVPLESPPSFATMISLRGVILSEQAIRPNKTVEIITWWTIEQPVDVDLVLFTQLLGADGLPISQMDRLDAPANVWVSGDHIVQLHELLIPADTPAGRYEIITGFYFPADGSRLPVIDKSGNSRQNFWSLGQITIRN
jgi:hypothetical protein